jgi:hypothetical protein
VFDLLLFRPKGISGANFRHRRAASLLAPSYRFTIGLK